MQNKNIFYTLGIITFLVFFYFLFFSAPTDFPAGVIVKIEKGDSLLDVSLKLNATSSISGISNVTQIMVSNDSTFLNAVWENYTTIKIM